MSSGPPPTQSQLSSNIRANRTLILCFDGTCNQFDSTSTNLLRLFSALEKNSPQEQLVYYQPGIGTYVGTDAPWSPAWRWLSKKIDSGLAWNIGTHILGGYKFLMQHYQKGDRICLFGFSRGAFTARCLGGMLHKVGLLPRSNMEQAEFAYSLYEDRKDGNVANARKFKKVFSSDVQVEFIGVWDTVSSVGIGAPLLPFNASETFVRTFRHALSIDERRAKFQVNPWQYKTECKKCHSKAREDRKKDPKDPKPDPRNFRELTEGIEGGKWTPNPDCWCQDEMDYHKGKLTNVKEVWFPGFHADVGGGNDTDGADKTLANPPLRWMVNEILQSRCGILFKGDAFSDWQLPTLNKTIQESEYPAMSANVPVLNKILSDREGEDGPQTESQDVKGSSVAISEMEQEENDAQAKWHDMLQDKRLWWILEVFPLYQYWFDRDKEKSMDGYAINFGANRRIDHFKPYLHKSVLDRKLSDHKYNPEDRVTYRGNLTYVHENEAKDPDLKAELEAASQVARIPPNGKGGCTAWIHRLGLAFLRHR